VQVNDLINASFELLASMFALLNVRRMLIDKKSHGVSKVATTFFVAWGVWNLYYYPSLGQWASFAGGVSMTTVNAVWLFLMWKYRKNKG